MQVDSSVGTAAINLTGNEFNNFIFGSAGDNVINGGGGADYMSGGKGNDTYFVDNPGDSLFENGDIHSTPQNESEGFDTVLTSVSFNVGLYSEIENATQHGFNPQVYVSEALGLALAFADENGGQAFANTFGPLKAA